MKRLIIACAVLLAMSTAFFSSAFAAEESPVCYPSAIIVSEDGTELKKIYDLSPEDDPAGIPRSDFEQGGFHYCFTDILRQELPEREERTHTETITLDSPKKDMESVLALLPQEREVVTEDGFVGTLSLKLDTVRVEVAGYSSYSKELSATRTYPNLDGQDTACIPKTIEDNGKTLTLQAINWQTSSTDNVDGYAIGERFTAIATYTGTSTGSYVSGYTVTADYSGSVGRINLNRVRYIAIFEGVRLVPEDPEPTETPLPAENPSADLTERNIGHDLKKSSEESTPVYFPWKLVLIPFGIIAVVGAGIGVALTMKRRSEASENLSNEEEDE
jgi:hypothetical protein